MAMNYNTIISLDFETGSIDPHTCEPLQLAAVAMNPRTLEIEPNGQFQVYMKPTDWNNVTSEALAINKITREIIEEKGVEQKLAWLDFVKFVKKYDTKNQFWSRPISCGHNIINYDLIIVERLAKLYGPTDREGKCSLFHNRDKYDLMFFCSTWFESQAEPKRYNLDELRDFFGMSKDNSHNAITDCSQTAMLVAKFLRLQREMSKKVKFKDSCKVVV